MVEPTHPGNQGGGEDEEHNQGGGSAGPGSAGGNQGGDDDDEGIGGDGSGLGGGTHTPVNQGGPTGTTGPVCLCGLASAAVAFTLTSGIMTPMCGMKRR